MYADVDSSALKQAGKHEDVRRKKAKFILHTAI